MQPVLGLIQEGSRRTYTVHLPMIAITGSLQAIRNCTCPTAGRSPAATYVDLRSHCSKDRGCMPFYQPEIAVFLLLSTDSHSQCTFKC